MTKYTSRYAELSFYVNGELRKFYAGEYRTDIAEEIAALDTLSDAVKDSEETTPKAPSTRKASVK
ncbi:hypothetical protein LOZ80_14950 [Paenibacillus sp. HWE-109]|uniref:hypothetical protein n=1 Tax=Paenibacillus sp. HWE-109 TaxID=1306526 RepID=UPI001EDFC41D|nr:hypothetical protein [Paenibacillus sp. HWE-109]UKS30159.1 hypothetical protein LOZ80_14950 [Paenibacillus sp. HWE-109]